MMRTPLTVISGYLGAGKTTLINKLVAQDHGLNLLVIVNDFGAINIDAELIARADGEQIALTNGCVCCSMDQDLVRALQDALARQPRPDHIIVEASGIADPASIAQIAGQEGDLGYPAIVTLVDAENAPGLLADELAAPQLKQQITAADLVLLTKTDDPDPALLATLKEAGARTPVVPGETPLAELLFDVVPLPRGRTMAAHPGYATWQHDSDIVLDRRALGDKLAARPEGLYRLKGFIQTSGGGYELHVVGQNVEARRAETDRTILVGLGLSDRISRDEIEAWWVA
jgi:Ni2+-binding GTPase involved in maturation of urease and hydrogenase